MLCARDTLYTTLVTCPIAITDSYEVIENCLSSGGGQSLSSSSIVVNEIVTCPDEEVCLPLLPIDYDDSKL